MTDHHIELQTDGKYCGYKCDKKHICFCYEFLNDHNPTTLEREGPHNYLRCQACLDSDVKEPDKLTICSDLTAKELEAHPNFKAENISHATVLEELKARDQQESYEGGAEL